MISAVILAAGMSTRMGVPKQLLALENRPLVRIVTENVLASSVAEVLVVTGYMKHEISAALNDLPVKIVFNPRYEQGQGTSLALGAAAADKNASALAVFMADQPLISASLINTVLDEFKKRRCLALRPVYNGAPGHPVIISGDLSKDLQMLQRDEGARHILKRLGSKVDYLQIQDEAAVFDIDTPEDFKKLKEISDILSE
jgi:molybdenum cofactor cytidylyltransferase